MKSRANGAECGIPFRDAYSDMSHVPSNLVFEGSTSELPLVTIAIPTFQRPDLLAQAVRSALSQSTAIPYEIVVADNDPASDAASQLIEAVPELSSRNFRYYVNRENIGLFPNHNRGIELARGSWVTILNDDDLLAPDFLTEMFAELTRLPTADGIVSRKRIFDERPGAGTGVPSQAAGYASEPMSARLFLSGLFRDRSARRHVLERLKSRLIFEYMFLGRTSRRVHPRMLFTGPALGNPVGFIFKKDYALQIGGFYSEDFPGADMYFFARYAMRHHLRQHREEKVSIRIAQNESARMATVLKAFPCLHTLQRMLAGSEVPRWWLRFAPLALTRLRGEYRESWGIDVPAAEIEQALGLRLPADRPKLLQALRILLRAH